MLKPLPKASSAPAGIMTTLRRWTIVLMASLLCTCTAAPDSFDSVAPGGTPITSALPVSAADVPQAAALRTAPRIALVIGNDQYANWGRLRFPDNDARAMAERLRSSGFELVGGEAQIDVSSARLHELETRTEAAVKARPGAIVAVYFSGHGFADQGHNYLVPTDAPEDSRAAPASLSVIEFAQRLNDAGSGLTMMFLDACREYQPGHGGGLVEEQVPNNTFLGFATLFGAYASEPSAAEGGKHSYYTAALLQALDAGMDRLDDLHLVVAEHVISTTQARQLPVYREGAHMPSAPVRLALNDPQTVYALARQRGASSSEAVAAQCTAMSDLRLVVGFAPADSIFAGMRIGPHYEPVDLSAAYSSCNAAYSAGHREAAVLRGLALTELLPALLRGNTPPMTLYNNAGALLAEAAEGGDALTDFILASIQNSSDTARAGLQLPVGAVGDRMEHAAEQNIPPITSLVGLLLWRPEFAEKRSSLGLPSDPVLGRKLFIRALLSGDPLVQLLGMSLRINKDPSVMNLPLRDGLRRAFSSSSVVGFAFDGFSVHQTLYFLALLDAAAGILGPVDTGEVVRLTLEAQPFLADLGQASARAAGKPNAVDLFFALTACALASGRDQTGMPLPGVAPNREIALRLLRNISANPPADARMYINRLIATGSCW